MNPAPCIHRARAKTDMQSLTKAAIRPVRPVRAGGQHPAAAGVRAPRPGRTRLLGEAGGLQPRRHQGPPRPAHGRAGPRPRRPAARRHGSSSPPAAPSASAWPWPGMVYGHPVTLVTDPGLEPSMTRLLTAYGAQVNVVSEPHPDRRLAAGPPRARAAAARRSTPAPGAPTSTTTPTTPPPTPRSPSNWPPSSATSTSWCAASAPAATPPASPACCGSSTRT